VLAVVIVVNLLTLTHYKCTDLGYSFVAHYGYRLKRESLTFARFLAAEMGDSLYARRFICEYIRNTIAAAVWEINSFNNDDDDSEHNLHIPITVGWYQPSEI